MSLNMGGPYPVATVQTELTGILENAFKEHYGAFVQNLRTNYSNAANIYTNDVLDSAKTRLKAVLPHGTQPLLPNGIYRNILTFEDERPNPFLQGLDEIVYHASGHFPDRDWAAKQDARYKFYWGAAIRHSAEKPAKQKQAANSAPATDQTAKSIKWLTAAVVALAAIVAILAVAIIFSR